MLYIKEILPNPTGPEAEGEWIRIINDGEEAVNPGDLHIVDNSGSAFYLNSIGSISPGETIELPRSTTDIALNNNGDTLKLISSNGDVVDELSYTSTIEGEVITAQRFIPEIPDAHTLQANAASIGSIDITPGLSPLLVGILVATLAAGLSWYLVNKFEGER